MLIELSRWLLLATLIIAPWNFGSTSVNGILTLEWAMGFCTVVWAAGLAEARRRPRLGRKPVALIALLLAMGWLMALCPRSMYDAPFATFVPIERAASFLPGSVDGVVSTANMTRISLLLAVLVMAADFAAKKAWRLRIAIFLSVNGAALGIFGAAFRPGSPELASFWGRDVAWNVFGPYWYHANAGAFLNICLSCALGLIYRCVGRPESQGPLALHAFAAIAISIGLFVNVSKASHVICLLILFTFAVGWVLRLCRGVGLARAWKQAVLGVGSAILIVAGVATLTGLDYPMQRWLEFSKRGGMTDSRFQAWQACRAMIPDTGIFGMGPGTFEISFPTYQAALSPPLEGHWVYAHNDYWQTLVEWGFLGALLWAGLMFGSLVAGLWNRAGPGSDAAERLGSRPEIMAFSLALSATLLHSTIDFPLQIASLQLYAFTMVGILWGWQSASTRQHHRRTPKRLEAENETLAPEEAKAPAAGLMHSSE